MRRVSPVYAIDTMPTQTGLSGELTIYFDADSLRALAPEAVTIFQWQEGWKPLPTTVNIAPGLERATARITETGHYVAYLDLNRAIVVDVEETDEVPGAFALSPNYPNPFNPETTIPFLLPQQGHVRLSVYDVLGREVAVLVDGVRTAGRHQAHFDASRLASGVYFYHLAADGFRQTRTMVLLR